MKKDRFNITVLIGTRPEAIKMAPVIRALQDTAYSTRILLSGQQNEMSIAALRVFDLRPDQVLPRHHRDFSLTGQAQGYLKALDGGLREHPCDLMLVHGDTTTGFIGALAAFYRRIPVGHVEAGLRSYDLENPFPEEANRRLIDPLCRLHFAPTHRARQNLFKEGIDPSSILVTGNTVVDAVMELASKAPDLAAFDWAADLVRGKRLILLTAHRRENWGRPLEDICKAVRLLADRRQDLFFVVPVHPNPNVRSTMDLCLTDHPRVCLCPPLDYLELIAVMRAASLILTDSGGIQEEAPCLGTPVLILRKVTERPEIIESGGGILVGTRCQDILAQTLNLLANPALHEKMATERNPFGDGLAGRRIVKAIDNWRANRPLDYRNEEFHWQQLARVSRTGL